MRAIHAQITKIRGGIPGRKGRGLPLDRSGSGEESKEFLTENKASGTSMSRQVREERRPWREDNNTHAVGEVYNIEGWGNTKKRDQVYDI